MSKPTWDTAPEWAQYRSQNKNGDWWYHQSMPSVTQGVWKSTGMMQACGHSSPNEWMSSVERNPKWR